MTPSRHPATAELEALEPIGLTGYGTGAYVLGTGPRHDAFLLEWAVAAPTPGTKCATTAALVPDDLDFAPRGILDASTTSAKIEPRAGTTIMWPEAATSTWSTFSVEVGAGPCASTMRLIRLEHDSDPRLSCEPMEPGDPNQPREPIGAPDGRVRPRFVGPDAFARLPRLEDVVRARVAVLGVPFDAGVSYRPGARFGASGDPCRVQAAPRVPPGHRRGAVARAPGRGRGRSRTQPIRHRRGDQGNWGRRRRSSSAPIT